MPKITYRIGVSSWTEKNSMQENLAFLDKQLHLSIPLITGADICSKKKKIKIYVGKEINLKEYSKETYLREKFDISLETLADIAVQGYDRACLLNYKKYDQVIIGVEEDALIVPDYFALKTNIVNSYQEQA